MAFTEAQINQLCKILPVTPQMVEDQITYLGATLTAQLQTDIETEIARWTTGGVGGKFWRVEGNVKNFGVFLDSESEKKDIIKNIARLFERPDWASAASSFEFQLVRG